MCLSVGSVKIGNDSLQLAVYNHADTENFLRVRVVGYPINTAEIVSVRCVDDFHLDGSPSSMETQGRKPLRIENPYIQSVVGGKILGYMILDWVKEPHVSVPLSGRFRDDINLLDVILIQSDYGHFSLTDELWVAVSLQHSLRTGLKEMSSTTVGVINVPDNPSQPVSGS
jgi:hypothetical protein